ncbi:MAG: hypothetical protein ACSLE9_01695 [Burkholderiaceae bacterium]
MHTASRAGALLALALTTSSLPSITRAGPADYVVTPIVEEGEREIDVKAGSAKSRDGSRESAYSVGFGWGATSWWFTEIYAKSHKEPGAAHAFDAWEWENKFQLTETGKYPVDIGLLLEIERPKDRSEGYEYRWGPLLQADLGSSVQANLNFLIEKHIRNAEAAKATLGYQWQVKYRWHPEFEFGFQGFGDVGPWNEWKPSSEQSHIAGPAIFGRVHVAERQAVRYNAGLLFGMNNGSPRNTVRVQAEYEF